LPSLEKVGVRVGKVGLLCGHQLFLKLLQLFLKLTERFLELVVVIRYEISSSAFRNSLRRLKEFVKDAIVISTEGLI